MVRTVHTAVHLQAPLVLKNNSVVDSVRQVFSTLALEVHFPAEFSTNPNQSQLNKLNQGLQDY